jgi:hypothetical protein
MTLLNSLDRSMSVMRIDLIHFDPLTQQPNLSQLFVTFQVRKIEAS